MLSAKLLTSIVFEYEGTMFFSSNKMTADQPIFGPIWNLTAWAEGRPKRRRLMYSKQTPICYSFQVLRQNMFSEQ